MTILSELLGNNCVARRIRSVHYREDVRLGQRDHAFPDYQSGTSLRNGVADELSRSVSGERAACGSRIFAEFHQPGAVALFARGDDHRLRWTSETGNQRWSGIRIPSRQLTKVRGRHTMKLAGRPDVCDHNFAIGSPAGRSPMDRHSRTVRTRLVQW